jgi:hypothetical protein
MLDVSLVEEFNNLGTNVSPQITAHREVTNLRTNSSPQIVLAKFVVLVDWLKPHETRILLWPRRRRENILGRPEDQLGTPTSGTPDTEIVKVGLELGDIVATEESFSQRLMWSE